MIKTYRPQSNHCSDYLETDTSSTLTTRYHYGQGGDAALIVYIIDAYTSNSMKSKNPHSGFHKADKVKCLDTACLNPTCNQGGVVIVQSL